MGGRRVRLDDMNTTEHPIVNDRTPALAAMWSAARDELRGRRQARADRKQLERELATYRTQAELDDLHALLDSNDDADSALVREILAMQLRHAA
jgi:hypothetical protein